jgi:hypothetical protein
LYASKVVGTGSDLRLQEHKNQVTNFLIVIVRSTTKRIYYPAPEKQRTLIHRRRRIRCVDAALLVQPKLERARRVQYANSAKIGEFVVTGFQFGISVITSSARCCDLWAAAHLDMLWKQLAKVPGKYEVVV